MAEETTKTNVNQEKNNDSSDKVEAQENAEMPEERPEQGTKDVKIVKQWMSITKMVSTNRV